MSPLYEPHQFIHAHLPPPASVHFSTPELRVTSNRPFPTSSEQLAEPLHPEHALSSSYNPEINILARVIQNGYGLELRPFDFTIAASASSSSKRIRGSDTIRLSFPDPLRGLSEGTIIVSHADARVYILVVTQADIVYRLSFPLGSYEDVPGSRFYFTLDNDEEWCEEYEVPQDMLTSCGGIGPVAVVDSSCVALGGVDGGIIKVTRDNGYWSAQQHRISSRFRLPSLFSSAGHDDEILSFAQYDYEDFTYLYALSRDGKLRLWDVDSGTVTKTVDCRAAASPKRDLVVRGQSSLSESSNSSMAIPTDCQYIRIIRTPSSSRYSHLVVSFLAYSNSPNARTFVVHRVPRADKGQGNLVYAGAKVCSAASAGARLRNFEILPPHSDDQQDGWKLWVCWDHISNITYESISVDDIFQFTNYSQPSHSLPLLYDWQVASSHSGIENLDAAHFDNLLPMQAPDPTQPYDHSDIAKLFINHLFLPGRFSLLTLTTALDDYNSTLPTDHTSSTASNTLSKAFSGIVGSQVVMQIDPQTGAPVVEAYRRDLKLEWLKVWARVKELDRHARYPIGSAIMDDQYIVICREGNSMPISEDASGMINRISVSDQEAIKEEFENLPDAAMSSHPLLADPSTRKAVLAAASTGDHLEQSLRRSPTADGTINAFDTFTEQLDTTLAEPAQSPVETIAGGLWDDHLEPVLTEDERSAARHSLSQCDDLYMGLESALDILSDITLPVSNEDEADSESRLAGFANAMVASALQVIIKSRFILAQRILLTAMFIMVEMDEKSTDEEEERTMDILVRALTIYHSYRVLQWLCEQTGEEALERTKGSRANKRRYQGEDTFMDGQGVPSVSDGQTLDDTDGYKLEDSLLHSIITRRAPIRSPVASSVYASTMTFLQTSKLISSDDADIEATPAVVKFAFEILVDNHPALAKQMTDLYPPSSGTTYIKGRACLDLGEIDEAADLLQRASAGCSDTTLTPILPPPASYLDITSYHRHITHLFEDHGIDAYIARFGQFTLESADSDDKSMRDIRTKVFLANLSLGAYEDAYVTLTKSTDLEQKKDFLGQLISQMCEANEIGRLNSLGFVGLQKEVERLLTFKARYSDPLRFPNYYKVLYSWHISRGDYRSAGETMYLQARRLSAHSDKSSVPLFELTAMQARSYLAAINCLSLVDQRNAWVSIPAHQSNVARNIKRRRITSQIPQDEFATDKPPIEITTLEDIRAEYTAVLSQLQLISDNPEIFGDGHITMTPFELVGMFVRRGMFDLAASSAVSLSVDMTPFFVALASRCVLLAQATDLSTPLDTSAISYLYSSPITSRLKGPPPALALRYLQVSLMRHDSESTQWRYRRAVADTLFEMNSDKRTGWQMPVWLVDWEMERDPEGWISRAVKWGWIEEAINWILQLLQRSTPPELLPPKKANVAYTPFNLIDRVIAAAKEGTEKDDKRVQERVRELEAVTRRRIEGLKRVNR